MIKEGVGKYIFKMHDNFIYSLLQQNAALMKHINYISCIWIQLLAKAYIYTVLVSVMNKARETLYLGSILCSWKNHVYIIPKCVWMNEIIENFLVLWKSLKLCVIYCIHMRVFVWTLYARLKEQHRLSNLKETNIFTRVLPRLWTEQPCSVCTV